MTMTQHGLSASRLTEFVGRETEIAELRALVAARRLVTITGPAGVGKSRTALRVAEVARRSFGDAVRIVAVDGLEADGVRSALAAAVGASGWSAAEIARTVGDRPFLIVLDDADRAVAIGAAVEDFLQLTTQTRIIVAARECTGVLGETVVVLGGLALPDAAVRAEPVAPSLALLVRRIAEADPSAAPTDDLDALATICRCADGLPRAIESGARAVLRLGAVAAAAAIREDPTVLDAFLPPSQATRTSAAALAAALAGLSPAARGLLDRLALFESGTDLRFAAEVFSDGRLAVTAPLVAELIDRSLVRVDGADRDLVVPPMHRRHLLAAWTTPDRAQDAAAIRRALLGRLREGARRWFSTEQFATVRFLNRHAADITAMLGEMAGDPASAHDALEVIASLRYYWQLHPVDPWPRVRDWLEIALATDRSDDLVRVRALQTDAYIAFHEGDIAGASAQLAAVRALAAWAGADVEDRRFGRFVEALVALAGGDLVESESMLRGVLSEALADGDREHVGEKYWYLATVQVAQGREADAAATLADGVRWCDRIGDEWGRGYMWWLLALVARRDGRHDEAAATLGRAVAVMSTFGDRAGLALCVSLLAAISSERGDRADAATLAGIAARQQHSPPPVQLRELAHPAPSHLGAPSPGSDGATLVETLTRIIGGEPPRAVATKAEGVDALSAREWEIATLVSEGLGNSAIAARLVLSRRTVEGHVQRILAKLGYRSRSQIAVWVAQRG